MKKLFIAVITVVAFSVASAQEVKFGAKGGLNLANLSGDLENTKAVLGAHFGGFAEIKISDKFAFQPELLFSMQGTKFEYSESSSLDGFEDSYSEKTTINASYINIPLMAKYYITDKFSLEAGPQIGFLVSAKAKFDYTETFGGETFSESGTEDVKEDFNNVDFGVNFGGSYNFTDKLFVSARYNLGLSDVAKGDEGENFKLNNSVFQFSIGIRF